MCASKANAIAERFVRTVRSERLEWLLIVNGRHLERVHRVFVDHYNSHRPHRSLARKGTRAAEYAGAAEKPDTLKVEQSNALVNRIAQVSVPDGPPTPRLPVKFPARPLVRSCS